MIINLSGGGASLNFKIVGGTEQPANPTENMIWVDTELDIVKYIFGNETPSELVTGETWFKTDDSGKVKLNILKKNVIELNLSACKQYIGDKLTSMNACIYQNGAWIKFSADWDGTLFNSGDQYTDITGGWVYADGTPVGVSITANAYTTASFGGYARTVNKINLKDHSRIYVNFTSMTRQNTIAIDDDSTVVNTAAGLAKYASFTGQTGEQYLDVTDCDGEYYVFVISGVCQNASMACSFEADKVRLE